MGALTTALVLGGIGANLWGAHKQASAAKEASGQQVDAANQAKAELAPIHAANVARMDPYAQLGGQAVGQLRALGGYPAPPPANANAVGRDAQGNPLGPVTANQPPMNMSDPRVQHLARGGSLADPPSAYGGSLASLGQPNTASSYGVSTGSQQGLNGASMWSQSGMVKMQSPDGSEQRDVPESMVAKAEQMGARRVG